MLLHAPVLAKNKQRAYWSISYFHPLVELRRMSVSVVAFFGTKGRFFSIIYIHTFIVSVGLNFSVVACLLPARSDGRRFFRVVFAAGAYAPTVARHLPVLEE